jgi:hypothetical protein
MNPTRYEITIQGEAGTRTCAAFEDFEISVRHGVTVLRGELADQAALHGVIDRIAALGLDLTELRRVAGEDA